MLFRGKSMSENLLITAIFKVWLKQFEQALNWVDSSVLSSSCDNAWYLSLRLTEQNDIMTSMYICQRWKTWIMNQKRELLAELLEARNPSAGWSWSYDVMLMIYTSIAYQHQSMTLWDIACIRNSDNLISVITKLMVSWLTTTRNITSYHMISIDILSVLSYHIMFFGCWVTFWFTDWPGRRRTAPQRWNAWWRRFSTSTSPWKFWPVSWRRLEKIMEK